MTAHSTPVRDIGIDSGLEVVDSDVFSDRPARLRDHAAQLETIQRIAHAFVESPETILHELAQAAITVCGADSAGISIEKDDASDQQFYQWVATAGSYTPFLGAMLPRYPSACGITLSRGRPQLFRVGQPFFDIMGIEAPLVTDGILLPWQVDGRRGTIFVMAHGRTEAFDSEDCRQMQLLADFAAMGVRQQRLHAELVREASAAAAADMANRLAHRINNPLQSLTNRLFLAAEGSHGEAARELGRDALHDLERLSSLVKDLLALPSRDRA